MKVWVASRKARARIKPKMTPNGMGKNRREAALPGCEVSIPPERVAMPARILLTPSTRHGARKDSTLTYRYLVAADGQLTRPCNHWII